MFKKFFQKLKKKIDIAALKLLIKSQHGVCEFSNGKFYSPGGFYIPRLKNEEPKIYPNGKWYEEGSVIDKWHKKFGYLTGVSVYYRGELFPVDVVIM